MRFMPQPHSNISVFNQNLNATLRDIKEQISTVQNKHFTTAHEENRGNPVSTLFQCRSYLSVSDCVACFDAATEQIQLCAIGTSVAYVVYDGCFLRFDVSSSFFLDEEVTEIFNATSCGNQTTEREAITFISAAQKLLMNLQRAAPTISGFSLATKTQLHNNGPTIYAFAQCIETITQSKCEDCLNSQYNNMQICLSSPDGRAFTNACFLRYSTTSFFSDSQAIDIITPLKKQGSGNKGIVIGGVVAGVSLALIFIALFAFIIIRRRKNPKIIRASRGDIPGASQLKGPFTFSYNALKSATKNFSEENKIGEGGFGAVYKGTLWNGKVVAIKRLTLRPSNKIDEEFESEVKLISNVHHRNLVRLLGYCSNGDDRILVYEYMKNKSLDIYLYGEKKGYLNWEQRYEVIIGIARGLTYLHEEFHVRIIHRDIKTQNILLDDDLQPRIADFGLARLIPDDKTHLSTKFAGTLGYTPPEYAIHGILSEKVDIYSYGVVVLEIISGQRCNKLLVDADHEGDYLLKEAWKLYERGMHLELVDNALDPNDYDADEVKKVIEIALLCTQPSAETRPTMSEIMVLLQKKGLLENLRPTMPMFIETT
ncbi:hypothetical protein K1719_024299 [Acacia pycnantha]|nr:hypothetical protein K1719_024299 [Acacia pycnantha]